MWCVRKWNIMKIGKKSERMKNRYVKGMLVIPLQMSTLLMVIPATTQTALKVHHSLEMCDELEGTSRDIFLHIDTVDCRNKLQN